jgi:hypothetical protein
MALNSRSCQALILKFKFSLTNGRGYVLYCQVRGNYGRNPSFLLFLFLFWEGSPITPSQLGMEAMGDQQVPMAFSFDGHRGNLMAFLFLEARGD